MNLYNSVYLSLCTAFQIIYCLYRSTKCGSPTESATLREPYVMPITWIFQPIILLLWNVYLDLISLGSGTLLAMKNLIRSNIDFWKQSKYHFCKIFIESRPPFSPTPTPLPLPPPLPIIAVSYIGICCAIVYIGLDHPGSDRIHGHMTIIGKPSFVPILHTAMHMSKSLGSHVLCTWGSNPFVRHCNVYYS